MKKFELDHLKLRIQEITRCASGTVATIINQQQKETTLSVVKKFNLIKSGKAKLLPATLLQKAVPYNISKKEALTHCYSYPDSAEIIENKAFNKRLKNRMEELTESIQKTGKRLIDKAALGLIKPADIPAALEKLNNMVEVIK